MSYKPKILTSTEGGTSQGSYATGDILYASASNTLSKLAAGIDSHVLTLSSGVPTWAAPSGGSVPNKEMFWKPSDFDALETNFAPLTQINGTTVKTFVRAFDDTTVEYVNFNFMVPGDIDTAGTVTFRVTMYAATAAASKNVALNFDHRAISDSEAFDSSYVTEASGDKAIDATQGDITIATWTETVSNLAWAANDFVFARLSRVDASSNDLSGDLYVLNFEIVIPRA